MSIILDAIAKSERERQQQEIPDARVLATPVVELRRPRRMLPYLVAGILLLNGILLLSWMRTGEFPFNGFSRTENNSNVPPGVDQTVAPNKVGSVNEASNIEPIIADTPIPGSGSKAAKAAVVDKSLEQKKVEAVPRVENNEVSSNRSEAIEPKALPNVINARDQLKPTHTQNSVASEPREIFSLIELPADVRRDLPSVKFSGHLYSTKLNVSYVMVDGGRSVIAGGEITGDLFLHEVTPTGAIVDFRGTLVQVDVLQNWSMK